MHTANLAQNQNAAAFATVLIRDARTNEERRIPSHTYVLAAPDDLAAGEPVQVKLDLSAPEYPAADIFYNNTDGEYVKREQVAVSRLNEDGVLPRSEWLTPEQIPGRESFFYRSIVKVDVLGAGGAEIEDSGKRYSAVVRGSSFTLTVTDVDAEGQGHNPVRYTGTAHIDRDALVIDVGEQAAAVPADILTALHTALEKRLGLTEGEAEQTAA